MLRLLFVVFINGVLTTQKSRIQTICEWDEGSRNLKVHCLNVSSQAKALFLGTDLFSPHHQIDKIYDWTFVRPKLNTYSVSFSSRRGVNIYICGELLEQDPVFNGYCSAPYHPSYPIPDPPIGYKHVKFFKLTPVQTHQNQTKYQIQCPVVTNAANLTVQQSIEVYRDIDVFGVIRDGDVGWRSHPTQLADTCPGYGIYQFALKPNTRDPFACGLDYKYDHERWAFELAGPPDIDYRSFTFELHIKDTPRRVRVWRAPFRFGPPRLIADFDPMVKNLNILSYLDGSSLTFRPIGEPWGVGFFWVRIENAYRSPLVDADKMPFIIALPSRASHHW